MKAEGQSFYHCVSRVVDRRFIFQTAGHGSPEAERFVLLMRRLEASSGVRVFTYALMSNHFHLLCEVPQAQELSETQLLERYCGYAEALAKGSSLARQGIRIVLGLSETISWKEVGQQYRKYLFVHGSLHTKTKRPAFDLATAQTVVEQQNAELRQQNS